ncbi:MAG TPA: hypothetical protein VLC98_12130 [Phnomibacter sp.]|nr:hypothetical protein [Phnomibacter sp.]
MIPKMEIKTSEMRWYLILFLLAATGGALRKWFISSGAVSNIVLGLQMITPFLMFYFRSHNSITPFREWRIFYLYFFYLGFHIIYPLQLTYYHGLFGMLIHGGFWLGIFYYFANRHLFEPARFMQLFLIIAIVELVLAFIQYQLPTNHFLNKYSSDIIEVATVGDKVRVTGTFSYLSGFTAYMMFYALMLWAMARMKLPQWMVFTAVVAGVAACFMTGSRSGMMIYIILVGGMLFREYPASTLFSVAGRLIIPALVITAIVLLYKKIPIFDQVELAYDNFMRRVEQNQQSGEQTNRFFTDLWYIQNANWQHPIFGIGTGSTYQGATQLFGTSPYVYEFGYVETEFTRVLLEGGWVLIILKWGLSIMMALQLSFKGFMRWAIWFVVAAGQPIVFNQHNAAFLLLGIALVDNIIWRQQIEAKHKKKLEEAERKEKEITADNQIAPAELPG